MSAKVIQLVNSAFFGLPQTVADPVQAAALLGIETIRDLVLVIGVFSQFDSARLQALSLHTLWNHSQRVSGMAKLIAADLKGDKKQVSNAFVAGLLHDIGKLVIADNLPNYYLEIQRRSIVENKPYIAVEQAVLGANHAQVAAYLFGLWGLPKPVIDAVAGHHHPVSEGGGIPVELISIYVANVIDHQVHPEKNAGKVKTDYDWEFLKKFNITDLVESWRQTAIAQ